MWTHNTQTQWKHKHGGLEGGEGRIWGECHLHRMWPLLGGVRIISRLMWPMVLLLSSPITAPPTPPTTPTLFQRTCDTTIFNGLGGVREVWRRLEAPPTDKHRLFCSQLFSADEQYNISTTQDRSKTMRARWLRILACKRSITQPDREHTNESNIAHKRIELRSQPMCDACDVIRVPRLYDNFHGSPIKRMDAYEEYGRQTRHIRRTTDDEDCEEKNSRE